jgi:hypothetical protein
VLVLVNLKFHRRTLFWTVGGMTSPNTRQLFRPAIMCLLLYIKITDINNLQYR